MSMGVDRGAEPASLLAGVANFRDLGGLPNLDGLRVRSGVVYRSEVIPVAGEGLSERDRAALERLCIGAVFDLRNPSERANTPTPWMQAPQAATLHVMPEELTVPGADMRQFMRRLRDGTLDADHIGELMRTTYLSMPLHFGGVLRRLFGSVAQRGNTAALVHCTAGKDRTGFVCAMLLHALDVPADAVMRDYLDSARYYTTERLLAQMEMLAGQALPPGRAGVLAELAQVKASYLDVALGEITRGWGSIQQYLLKEAGLDRDLRHRLKLRLLA